MPFPEHGSVNDFIDKEFCSAKYSTIDDAIKMSHKLGKNAKLAKWDIKSAFRLLSLSPGDFDLMEFKFENQYFVDKCLSISCSLFDKFSTALEQESNNDNILNYLDDFVFGEKAKTTQCCNTLKIFQKSCKVCGSL